MFIKIKRKCKRSYFHNIDDELLAADQNKCSHFNEKSTQKKKPKKSNRIILKPKKIHAEMNIPNITSTCNEHHHHNDASEYRTFLMETKKRRKRKTLLLNV